MERFSQQCPYCQKTLHSLSEVYCPYCGVILKGKKADLDRDRVRALMQRADDFLKEEAYPDGIYLLIDALRLQPDNAEVLKKLNAARRQYRLARMYEWAEEHYFAHNLDAALANLNEIAAEAPNYRNIKEMIPRIEDEKNHRTRKEIRKQRIQHFWAHSMNYALYGLLAVFSLVMLIALLYLVGLLL